MSDAGPNQDTLDRFFANSRARFHTKNAPFDLPSWATQMPKYGSSILQTDLSSSLIASQPTTIDVYAPPLPAIVERAN